MALNDEFTIKKYLIINSHFMRILYVCMYEAIPVTGREGP
jgi:hypothetical protein